MKYNCSKKIEEAFLEPCPFCGGNAVLNLDAEINSEESHYITCNNCTMGHTTRWCDSDTKEQCINSWNTRFGG